MASSSRVQDPLAQMVGRVFAFGFEGTEPDTPITRFLKETSLSTVIVFARNFTDAHHLTTLTARLTEIAQRPLLICADQEGGSVLRVKRGGTLFPSARALGRLGPQATRQSALMMGLEMRAMGLNLDLAPVLDVNHPQNPGIGIRSFGEDPRQVAQCARAFVEGMIEGGCAPTTKHFPGKGHARKDAHLDLPIIDKPRAQLEQFEYFPFLEAFAAGCPAAMTSHCVYTALDELPGTLSKVVLTDLLRKEMGFKGVLVTDDMRMGAIVKGVAPEVAAVRSFLAGADLLLICRGVEVQQKAFDLLLDAARSDRAYRVRLEESVDRVDKLLAWVAQRAAPSAPIEHLHATHAPRIDALVHQAIEVRRDPSRLLPLGAAGSGATSHTEKSPRMGVLFPDLAILTPVEERVSGEEQLLERLAREVPADIHRYDPREPDLESPALAAFLAQHQDLMVFSANAVFFAPQAQLVEKALRRARRAIHVALRNPEDERFAPAPATVIATLGYLPNTLGAVGDVLLGKPRES